LLKCIGINNVCVRPTPLGKLRATARIHEKAFAAEKKKRRSKEKKMENSKKRRKRK